MLPARPPGKAAAPALPFLSPPPGTKPILQLVYSSSQEPCQARARPAGPVQIQRVYYRHRHPKVPAPWVLVPCIKGPEPEQKGCPVAAKWAEFLQLWAREAGAEGSVPLQILGGEEMLSTTASRAVGGAWGGDLIAAPGGPHLWCSTGAGLAFAWVAGPGACEGARSPWRTRSSAARPQ